MFLIRDLIRICVHLVGSQEKTYIIFLEQLGKYKYKKSPPEEAITDGLIDIIYYNFIQFSKLGFNKFNLPEIFQKLYESTQPFIDAFKGDDRFKSETHEEIHRKTAEFNIEEICEILMGLLGTKDKVRSYVKNIIFQHSVTKEENLFELVKGIVHLIDKETSLDKKSSIKQSSTNIEELKSNMIQICNTCWEVLIYYFKSPELISEYFDEVNRANLRKIDENGKFFLVKDCKVMKPDEWKGPKLDIKLKFSDDYYIKDLQKYEVL